jgi:hypothetical protein
MRRRVNRRRERLASCSRPRINLQIQESETDESPVAYRASLRQAIIDDNVGHVNIIVCEADYRALKRGIEHLPPPPQ